MTSLGEILGAVSRRVLVRTRWGNLTGRAFIDFTLIAAGCLLMALAVDVFLDPNNVVPGGFTALAMFANRWWGWPVGVTLLALNVPFLLIGMRVLGLAFGPKTLFAILLSSLAIDLLRPLVPTVRGEPLLYTLYGGLLYGLGMGLVFRANATTGGTEIPAKLLEHFYGVRMSGSLLAMDVVVLLLAAFFFGLAPALYALIAAWVMARVIDFVEEGFAAASTAFIITSAPEAVRSRDHRAVGARGDDPAGRGRLQPHRAHRADDDRRPPAARRAAPGRQRGRPRCVHGDQPQPRGVGRGVQAADAGETLGITCQALRKCLARSCFYPRSGRSYIAM